MRFNVLQEIRLGLLHLFYPSLCEGCGKTLLVSEKVLCLNCALQLPLTNYHHLPDNETATRFAGRVPFEYATSFGYFTNEGLLQHLLHGLKYKNKQEIGLFLGELFAVSLLGIDWVKTLDYIIPVPLHHKKEASRGFNQSKLLADGMGKVLKIPVNCLVLQRTRHTESQTKKSRTERLKNMDGAFSLCQPELLKDKHVFLLDDVLTTGATLESCALTLSQIEGIKISIATIGIVS